MDHPIMWERVIERYHRLPMRDRFTCSICTRQFFIMNRRYRRELRDGKPIVCVDCRSELRHVGLAMASKVDVEFSAERCVTCNKIHMIMIGTEQREYLKCNRCGTSMASTPENEDAVVGKIEWIIGLQSDPR